MIVDDDPISRLHMEQFLRHQGGFEIFVADDGLAGLELFRRERPDLVLMDIVMPRMDGYEATRLIKQEVEGDRLVPVIFLTGVTDDESLSECLHCGGDDFISKPLNNTILKARMAVWIRRVDMMERIRRDRMQVEQVILRMRQEEAFDARGIEVLMSALDSTNGDIVLSASRPNGVQHLLVGDFTGHGLPAAVSGPLVSEIFYSMTARDISCTKVLQEINHKLYRKLPVEMFLAGVMLEVDRAHNSVHIWNCSMPEVYCFNRGQLRWDVHSAGLPMGVVSSIEQGLIVQHKTFAPGDRIYVGSDGICEAQSMDGEMFGMSKLQVLLTEVDRAALPISTVEKVLADFRDGAEQGDDITLVALAAQLEQEQTLALDGAAA
uniref:Putative Response regulator protein n=1 Tax=Magnetococcus massalia (strain MO-1) TaxID=451514 RepID=A0A1S7LCS5_MAGMO|nr:putative Response regulator protein [Candidatus Magnetococcus massalia]